MDATEDANEPPQRKEASMPAADLNALGPPRTQIRSRVTGQPGNWHASTPANRLPDMAARESSQARDTGAPCTEPTPGAGHAADPPPPPAHGAQTAGHTGTAQSTALARRSDAGTPGDAMSAEAPTQGPPQAHAESDARATTPDTPKSATDPGPSPGGHAGDEDSFDTFMESCSSAPQTEPAPTASCSHPEPRGDHTEFAEGPLREPLAVSRQAHLRRDYAALLARTEDTAATDAGHATAHGAADQTPHELPRQSAQGSGTRVETGTNSASMPAEQPPWATRAWGQGHLDYARSEGDARRPNTHAERAAAKDLDLSITRINTAERCDLGVSIRWLLTSHSRHLENGTRTMADVAFGHRAGPHAPPTTMDHPSQWHYVASRLMAHMGTYSLDKMNGLYWLWHGHAALGIHEAMQRHNIWAIPGSPGYQGHASVHRRPRSQKAPEPPRQMARHDSPRRDQEPL